MKWVKKESDYKVPIKSWCADIEPGALIQAVNLAHHPSVMNHVALMPDCHQGYGMPIGGVIACNNAIIPNAVGVDIGCGMITVETDFQADQLDTETVKRIMGKIREVVPVGFGHQKDIQQWEGFKNPPAVPVVIQELKAASKQLGTLGGGNHFIEIQQCINDYRNNTNKKTIWFMVHSGSRNFGFRIANEYHKKAKGLCERWFSNLPDPDLSFLPLEEEAAQEYILGMQYALNFAHANRFMMMQRIAEIVDKELCCKFESPINIHHNFAQLEHHFGKDLWIHRKGATMACEGQYGIIPGSMGTPSYIVKGLGNKDSFLSCSHGAGRRMGRGDASRSLTVEDCDKDMEGIVFGRWNKDRKGRVDLGEAPKAYKDIEEVIDAQNDLVEIVVKLKPLGVIKG